MATPGDTVFQISTIHVDPINQNCVVEVNTGVLPKAGEPAFAKRNIQIPWDGLGGLGEALQAAVRGFFGGLKPDDQPEALRGAEEHVPAPVEAKVDDGAELTKVEPVKAKKK